MSRIEKLIKEKCPEGVEYKQIKEIAQTNIGLATSVTANKADSGVQLLHNSDIQQNKIVIKKYEYITEAFAEKNRSKIFKLHDIITVHTGDVGTSAVIEEEYVGSIGFTTITTRIYDFDEMNPYFLAHYLNSNVCKNDIAKVTISDRSNLNQKEYELLYVPVPPIEVQKEIVRILDKFTELEAGLQDELEARKKQYEYYRDKLFVFSDSVVRKKLGDVIEVCMCKRILKNQTSYEGEVPFYQNGTLGKEATLYISQELFEELSSKYKMPVKGEVMLSTVGTIGRTIMYDGESAYFQDSNIVWLRNHEKEVTNEYLYWFCRTMPWKMHSRATLKHLHNYMIVDTEIPIPSFAEQKKIVSVLKIFSDIVEDEKEGLPAEIKARHKQYEYYRDKLLTFKRKVV